MIIRIDADSTVAIFDQVAASVRADIVAARLVPGDRLPSAREVAAGLNINIHTVLRAYQQLRDEGLIALRRGRGAVVSAAAGPLVELAHDIHALVGRAAALGISPVTLASLVKETTHD